MRAFERLLDEFFAYWWESNPVHATAVGIHAHDDRLERFDPASLEDRRRRYRDYVRLFERTDPADPGAAIDRDIVLDYLRWELMELEVVRSFARNPAKYVEGALNGLYLVAVREFAPAADRAAGATARLAAVPRLLDEARENLADPAPIFVETAVAVARSGLALLEQVLPANLGRALMDDPPAFARWEAALRGAESALVDFARWLEDSVLPEARGDFALGRDAFQRRLLLQQRLNEDVDAIAAFGETLKRDTESKLAAVAAEIEPGRHWRDVAESLKDDHPAAGDLIRTYADEVARARDFVIDRDLVTVPGGESLEVVPTPEYLRPLVPYAAYQPPAPHEAEQKGLFFVTPPDPGREAEVLRDHPVHGIVVTALHEAYPGHHLQLSRSNRADSEPRRVLWSSIFAEGWALYCEELMWESGFYTDPRQRLLQLKDLLWRACRVVADVGLHAGGWTTDQARDYMIREAGLEPVNAAIEIRRYCAEPTQPLSYAVGKREILRIREAARRKLGDAFHLRDFHDALLSWGTIPPALVERGMGLDGT